MMFKTYRKSGLFIFILCCLIINIGTAQELNIKNNRGGLFSLGGRSTISMFNDNAWSNLGTGIGGQFRLQLADRLNTEWFFDYINGNTSDFVSRTDYHIGWSVMFYPFPVKEELSLIQPYLIAGHCFDYTVQQEVENPFNQAKRFSSAVQAGIGTHFNLSKRLDLSLAAQYMLHLGKHVHGEKDPINGMVHFHEERGTLAEGHILIHLGFNFKIIDLW